MKGTKYTKGERDGRIACIANPLRIDLISNNVNKNDLIFRVFRAFRVLPLRIRVRGGLVFGGFVRIVGPYLRFRGLASPSFPLLSPVRGSLNRKGQVFNGRRHRSTLRLLRVRIRSDSSRESLLCVEMICLAVPGMTDAAALLPVLDAPTDRFRNPRWR